MYDECLVILIKWLIEKKNAIYSQNIKEENNENELEDYKVSLEKYANDLIGAINKELFSELKVLGWPQELMDCIKDEDILVDIKDNIRSLFITYPFNRSEIHRRELEREKAGLQ